MRKGSHLRRETGSTTWSHRSDPDTVLCPYPTPQGSILSPVLFSVNINSLAETNTGVLSMWIISNKRKFHLAPELKFGGKQIKIVGETKF